MGVDLEVLRRRFETMPTAELQLVRSSSDYTAEAQTIAGQVLDARHDMVAASPDAERCVDHPLALSSATCARCGRFICFDCDPALGRTGSGQCLACRERVIAARGSGLQKWLGVLIVYLGVAHAASLVVGVAYRRLNLALLGHLAMQALVQVAALAFFRGRAQGPVVRGLFVTELIFQLSLIIAGYPSSLGGIVAPVVALIMLQALPRPRPASK